LKSLNKSQTNSLDWPLIRAKLGQIERKRGFQEPGVVFKVSKRDYYYSILFLILIRKFD